ncbi:hypothetical protein OY671_004455 [Metschnikowia pulcherrima]|nr:hypothetical protein OY671_004455 [Metschnikowia pulcherrima]
MSAPTAPQQQAADPDTKSSRSVGGRLSYLFILGDVLGAGVYALVGEMAGEVGGAVWSPLLVALGLASSTAGSYAELVTKYPQAGGAAVFADRAFRSPLVSFLVGFSMLAAGVTSAAGLSLAFAGDYFATFVDAPDRLVAVSFLAVVAALNARGIKESSRANVAMTAIESSGLVLVVVLAAVVSGRGEGSPGRVTQFAEGTTPALAVLAAAILAYYSFVGFETSANLAEEVRDVRRTYPRASFGALVTAGVVYVAVGVAAVAVVDPETLAGSTGPSLEVVDAEGSVPAWVFSLVASIAVANGASLTMIMASRLAYGMAEQGSLPATLGRVLPRRRTPWVAIVVTTVVAMGLVFTGDVAGLAETVVSLSSLVFASTNVAVLVSRRDPVDAPHFRVATVVPVSGVASCVSLSTQQDAVTWSRAGISLAVGAVSYVVMRWTRRAADARAARTVDPIGRERRSVRAVRLSAAGVVSPLLAWWLTTWEGNYHLGSVWHYVNQAESRAEPWSAAAIESNREHSVAAALSAVAGLVCLVASSALAIRASRHERHGEHRDRDRHAEEGAPSRERGRQPAASPGADGQADGGERDDEQQGGTDQRADDDRPVGHPVEQPARPGVQPPQLPQVLAGRPAQQHGGHGGGERGTSHDERGTPPPSARPVLRTCA